MCCLGCGHPPSNCTCAVWAVAGRPPSHPHAGRTAPVLHVHILHHLQPAALWRSMGEDDDRPPVAGGEHALEPGHLLIVNVHLVHAAEDGAILAPSPPVPASCWAGPPPAQWLPRHLPVRVAAEADGGQPHSQRGAQLRLPVVLVPKHGVPGRQVGIVCFELVALCSATGSAWPMAPDLPALGTHGPRPASAGQPPRPPASVSLRPCAAGQLAAEKLARPQAAAGRVGPAGGSGAAVRQAGAVLPSCRPGAVLPRTQVVIARDEAHGCAAKAVQVLMGHLEAAQGACRGCQAAWQASGVQNRPWVPLLLCVVIRPPRCSRWCGHAPGWTLDPAGCRCWVLLL